MVFSRKLQYKRMDFGQRSWRALVFVNICGTKTLWYSKNRTKVLAHYFSNTACYLSEIFVAFKLKAMQVSFLLRTKKRKENCNDKVFFIKNESVYLLRKLQWYLSPSADPHNHFDSSWEPVESTFPRELLPLFQTLMNQVIHPALKILYLFKISEELFPK